MRFWISLCLYLASPVALATSPEILSRCKGKWKDDARMVSYCIKKQEDAKTKLKSMNTGGVIGTPCKDKWEDDYPMVVYCIDKQEKARAKLKATGAPANVTARCEDKWDDDFSMVKYCIEKQVTAKKDLEKLAPSSSVLSRCTQKWDDDYSMVLYCAKKSGGGSASGSSSTRATSATSAKSSSSGRVWPGYFLTAPIRGEMTSQFYWIFFPDGTAKMAPKIGGKIFGIMTAKCSSTSRGFSCRFLDKDTGATVVTKHFTVSSGGASFTQTDTGVKSCRVSESEGKAFVAGRFVQGCR